VIDILNGQLNNYTNEQLSRYTNRQLSVLSFFGHVYDRTEEDVLRWRELHDKGWIDMNESEREEWLGFMKGRYSHEDLNRVESNVEALSIVIRGLGYTHPEISIKADWTNRDEFSITDAERYLNNIRILRNSIAVPNNTPRTPNIADKFDYVLANNIEKILANIETVTLNLQNAWYHNSDIISGEV
jgi:hypothetical protein